MCRVLCSHCVYPLYTGSQGEREASVPHSQLRGVDATSYLLVAEPQLFRLKQDTSRGTLGEGKEFIWG